MLQFLHMEIQFVFLEKASREKATKWFIPYTKVFEYDVKV